MGYFNHLYSIEKDRLEELRCVQNIDELIDFCKKYNYEYDYYEDDLEPPYVGLYNLANGEIYDFGEAMDEIIEAAENCGEKLFYSDAMNEKFEHYYPLVVDKDFILKAIEAYRNKVYQNLKYSLEEKSDKCWHANLTREERFIKDARSKIFDWVDKYGPANLNENSVNVTSSWLYEYAFFNLVAQYKAFNEEKYALYFMGW